MVKVFVLGKGVQRQLSVHLVQSTEKRSHKLHAADPSKKLGSALIRSRILSLESNEVISRQDFDVLGGDEVISHAEQMGSLSSQGASLLHLS